MLIRGASAKQLISKKDEFNWNDEHVGTQSYQANKHGLVIMPYGIPSSRL